MSYSRRNFIRHSAAAVASVGLVANATQFGFSQEMAMLMGDEVPTSSGKLIIHPVSHASVALSGGGKIIYADPVGDAALYEKLPKPDLVLITHEHGDHYNADTLAAVVGENTRLVTNPAVMGMLSADMQRRAVSLSNGDRASEAGFEISAIPAYNTTEDRKKYHPEGRDNGYVLTIDGLKVYIAGDTEDISEMRALTDIGLAFLPMNMPYTMTIDQAASAVGAFTPDIVYPYHHRGSDVEAFKALVDGQGNGTEVRLANWY